MRWDEMKWDEKRWEEKRRRRSYNRKYEERTLHRHFVPGILAKISSTKTAERENCKSEDREEATDNYPRYTFCW